MSRSYSLMLAIGILAGFLWLGWASSTSKSSTRQRQAVTGIDAGLVSALFGLLAARLGFVFSHWEYYSSHPEQILMFWEGGLSWIGAGIGVVIGLGIFAAIKHQSFWALLDCMAVPAAIIAFASWFGCLLEGCAYGKRADLGILTPPSSDIFGTIAHRWPVQGTGSLLCLGLFLLLRHAQRRSMPMGASGCISLASLSAIHLLLAFFRGDMVPTCCQLRLDALASGILFVLSCLFLVIRITQEKKKGDSHEKNNDRPGANEHPSR